MMSSFPNMTHTFSWSFDDINTGIVSIEDSWHIVQMVTLALSTTYVYNSDSAVILLNNTSQESFETKRLPDHLDTGNICRESSSSSYNIKVFHCVNSRPRQYQKIAIHGVNFDKISQVRVAIKKILAWHQSQLFPIKKVRFMKLAKNRKQRISLWYTLCISCLVGKR